MSTRSATAPPSPYLWPALLLATVLTFPFLNKAFHIDDPVYVWVAEQISKEPLDFYGFEVNWHGVPQPVAQFNQNPPLYSYSLALPGMLFGFTEPVMHLVNWAWLLLLLAGVRQLASRFCRNPVWAAMLVAVLPVVVVSTTSVMCDIAMLALYTWSIHLWLLGLDRGKWSPIAAAALVIAAAGLTKYFAVSLVPLLFVRSILPAKDRWAAAWLVVPILIWGGYEVLTRQWYQAGGVSNAADYIFTHRIESDSSVIKDPTNSLVNGFCFLGGLCLPAAVLLLTASSWRALMCLAVTVGLVAVGYHSTGIFVSPGLLVSENSLCAFAAVFATCGGILLVEAARRGASDRSPDWLLLVLWVCGTFAFSTGFNWTVNARSLVAAAVPVAILAVSRLESLKTLAFPQQQRRIGLAVALGAILSLGVAWGDAELAGTQRELANEIQQALTARPETSNVWFEGHWGFQYYMQARGFLPLDVDHPQARVGDFLVLPDSNSNVIGLPEGTTAVMRKAMKTRNNSPIAVMDTRFCAGYYSAQYGDLPYMWGAPATMLAVAVEMTAVPQP